ncbi:MAG: helix-turn-helix domain-containing protein [Planctomycetota bacterium]
MAFWTQPVEPELRDTVARWCFSTNADLTLPWSVQITPDGRIDLLVSVRAEARSMGHRPCHCELFGVKTRPLTVTSEQPGWSLAVQFQPGAVSRLFGMPAREVTDEAVPTSELTHRMGQDWVDRISGLDTLDGLRAAVAQCLLQLRAEHANVGHPPDASRGLAGAATDLMTRCQGRLTIQRLTHHLGVNPRQLERAFLQHIGVSPKRYARILRFQHADRLISAGRPLAWVAATAGYCDQAHLCRDFRAFTDRTPRQKTTA